MRPFFHGALGCTLALALAACSSGNRESDADADANVAASNEAVPSPTAENIAAGNQAEDKASPATVPSAGKDVIDLEGLGDLRIGEPVPKGSKWAERGAQTSDTCRTVTSPDYPGVYAIVSDGKVGRITVGERSSVKLIEGIGVGSTEKEVESAFGGFRAEPHKYVEAPAKYLTAPNAASGDPAVRFEIGKDGKVSLLLVGKMPVLGLVEGCS